MVEKYTDFLCTHDCIITSLSKTLRLTLQRINFSQFVFEEILSFAGWGSWHNVINKNGRKPENGGCSYVNCDSPCNGPRKFSFKKADLHGPIVLAMSIT